MGTSYWANLTRAISVSSKHFTGQGQEVGNHHLSHVGHSKSISDKSIELMTELIQITDRSSTVVLHTSKSFFKVFLETTIYNTKKKKVTLE